jgi:DNA-binding MarR family transcriptional regulator
MREECQQSPSSMVLLPRLTKQVMRRATDGRLGIDMRLLITLSYLRDHEGAPQQELADALCVDPSNVVLVLNELEELGYVERRRDREDRRRHRVSATAAGRRVCERAESVLAEVEREVLLALEDPEREVLRELLRRALRSAAPDAGQPLEAGAISA